jgi:hypothetical protein
MSIRPLVLWLSIAVLASAPAAHAAGVAVQSGSLDMGTSTGSVLIAGDAGFALDANVSTVDGVFAPLACNMSPRACPAGTTVDLTALWTGDAVRATVSIEGRTYTSVGSVASSQSATMRFSGGALLPPITSPSAVVTAPFTFDGAFDYIDADGAPTRAPLSGHGTASLSLARSTLSPDTWTVTRVVYAFDHHLPGEWAAVDVGDTGLPGSADLTGGQFAVSGAGADVWGSSDGFHFVFRRATTDADVITHVTGFSADHPYAKAGVMMRAGIDSGAAHVLLTQKPDGELEFMTRATTDGATEYLGGAWPEGSTWLRLNRRGNIVTALHSADGLHWTTIGETSISEVRYAGVLVSSHDSSRAAAATFGGTTVEPAVAPAAALWTAADIGAVGAAGSTAVQGGSWIMRGAGADIWGSVDAFHSAFRAAVGDVVLTSKVLRLQNTDTFAKAGLMIRSGSSASASHVILDVRPSGEIEFMARTVAGGATTYLGGAFSQFPVSLRLERRGAEVIAFRSADGAAWMEVGRVPMSFEADTLSGLVVTSHRSGVLTEAAFDQPLIAP